MKIVETTVKTFIVACELNQDDAHRIFKISKQCGDYIAGWVIRKMFPSISIKDAIQTLAQIKENCKDCHEV